MVGRMCLKGGVLLLLCWLADPAVAQSPFSTGADNGSILLREDGGFFQYVFTKDAFKVSYERNVEGKAKRVWENPMQDSVQVRFIPRYGINVQATPGGNLGSLFVSDDLQAGAGVTLSFGFGNVFSYRSSKRGRNLADLLRPILTAGGPSLKRLNQAVAEATRAEAAEADTVRMSGAVLERAVGVLAQERARMAYQQAVQEQKAAEKVRGDAVKALREREAQVVRGSWSRFVERLRDAGETLTPEQRAWLIRELDRQGPGSMIYDKLDLLISFSRSAYTFLDEDTSAFDQQARKNHFNGLSARLAYSSHFGGHVSPVVGASVGVERRNNINDLKQLDLRDVVFTSRTDSVTRSGEVVRKVYTGALVERVVGLVETDFVCYPLGYMNRLAVDLFTRTRFGDGGLFIRPGVGFFFTEKEAPLKVVGGLSLSRGEDGNLRVDLVAGFNF